ncbi:hypothetical protein HYPSUDRAFT_174038 [Hypholoma sublateritium FD-334 SS-4]|uniref:RRM domain-containing protein n=1 Tax=Hypholoma sublateritium (strain FD-334 SS-4) TaxID=945553 RepID=A0A0D2NY92_HYPSF|nr:hypothetical protein HYPSUDRAFT_174038 [Hypholoma sublateritium FD-334 SS-4]
MAPKKAKKISLNEFLGDSALGSWADEMESLPNAPAARTDEDQAGDRFGRRGDDFLTSRPDRQSGPPREDVPIPSQPPYTAFVGNLAFDLTETELGEFFSGTKVKSIKIIKDKDEKPKGFGYIEFDDVEGLKDALAKTGTNFSGRTVRVSVAEPPKERGGFGGSFEDSAKFDNPWRRDGPLPDLTDSRDASRRRFDGPSSDRPDRPISSAADGVDQWRSSRPQRISESDAPPFKRKGSGFLTPEGQVGAADKEDVWTIGSKFKSSANGLNEDVSGRPIRSRGDMLPPKEIPGDDSDWRSSARQAKSVPGARSSISPTSSTPPTPQLARRKLELLPKSGNASVTPSPLSSPKMGPTAAVSQSSRPNPFGAARPVDVSSRDKEVAERIERERGATHEKLAMSRSSSRTGIERSVLARPQTPPVSASVSSKPLSFKGTPTLAPTVRPTLSFANVAAKKEAASNKEEEEKEQTADEVEQVSEEVAKVVI